MCTIWAYTNKFLSTLSLRRATPRACPAWSPRPYFYPRSPCGERLDASESSRYFSYFYPRSPCGERLKNHIFFRHHNLFLSTLSLRRATEWNPTKYRDKQFLSTLSLRRATRAANCQQRNHHISIHALLAESDLAFRLLLSP